MTNHNISDEKIFKGENDIKYRFRQSEINNKYLVIFFSGFSKLGLPPRYNYPLLELDANKLFILDEYGPRPPAPVGCYYMGKNRDFSVERSTISLINHIADKHDFKFENIIACGSSKGGYVALYFGFKYGFGRVISGAPQYFLGKYLLRVPEAVPVAEYIYGKRKLFRRKYLDNLLSRVIKNSSYAPEVFIHASENDPHYKNHIKPLIKLLSKKKISYELDLSDYREHRDVGTYFKTYLFNKLVGIIFAEIYVNEKKVAKENEAKFQLMIDAYCAGHELQYAWYIYKDGEIMEKLTYSDNNILNYQFTKPGRYMVQYFVRSKRNFQIKNIGWFKEISIN